MPKLVIFDFDGTLADSAAWFMGALNDLAPRHHFRQASETELQALRGSSNREIIKALGVDRWRLPFIAADMRRRMAGEVDAIRLFDGVPEMLQALAGADVVLAVVSSNAEANVRRVLGPSADRISLFACGVGLFGKARRFRQVMARLKVAPDDTLCIGDEQRDIEAAQAVGAGCGAVLWGYATAEALAVAGPDMTFASVGDIAGLVQSVSGSGPT